MSWWQNVYFRCRSCCLSYLLRQASYFNEIVQKETVYLSLRKTRTWNNKTQILISEEPTTNNWNGRRKDKTIFFSSQNQPRKRDSERIFLNLKYRNWTSTKVQYPKAIRNCRYVNLTWLTSEEIALIQIFSSIFMVQMKLVCFCWTLAAALVLCYSVTLVCLIVFCFHSSFFSTSYIDG